MSLFAKKTKSRKLLIFLLSVVVLIFAVYFAMGFISGKKSVNEPSTDNPITLQDKENCQLAFVALADTQLYPAVNDMRMLEYGFKDMANAECEFDALLIAGDIAEMGDKRTYKNIWEEIDKSIFANKNVLLATGNHDIRIRYKRNTKLVMNKAGEYNNREINTPYYSQDINGYTFIVMNSDAWQFEKAIISDEQLSFLDSEIARGTKGGKPVFVICHQPLTNTHGLPEVWKNGDLGEDSAQVKEIFTKYKNVFYLNGHLHDGIYENSLEIFDEEKGVYSINLPSFGPVNDYGEYLQRGLGNFVEVYSDRVVFTARDFLAGEPLEGYTKTFELK